MDKGGSGEPSTLMTGRMGSPCDITCVYGDELDDGSDDGCDGVAKMMAVHMAERFEVAVMMAVDLTIGMTLTSGKANIKTPH